MPNGVETRCKTVLQICHSPASSLVGGGCCSKEPADVNVLVQIGSADRIQLSKKRAVLSGRVKSVAQASLEGDCLGVEPTCDDDPGKVFALTQLRHHPRNDTSGRTRAPVEFLHQCLRYLLLCFFLAVQLPETVDDLIHSSI